jgi:hypothetical protein
MSTVVEFILARIADEETQARREARQARQATDGATALAIAADPASRTRADCDARREMVGILQRMMILHDHPSERPQRDSAAQLLKLMAVPYEDHPAYRAEWRP